MILPNDIPYLTIALYESQTKLTGLYFVPQQMRIRMSDKPRALADDSKYSSLPNPYEISVMQNSFVFLKNSIIHNEDGPAIIGLTDGGLSFLRYASNNSMGINKPFEAFGHFYTKHPSHIELKVRPTWNGSQFEFSISEIYQYFYIENGLTHCDEGPAKVRQSLDGAIHADYYNWGYFCSEIKIEEMKNKSNVLKVIRES